jgi:hypothetical protein
MTVKKLSVRDQNDLIRRLEEKRSKILRTYENPKYKTLIESKEYKRALSAIDIKINKEFNRLINDPTNGIVIADILNRNLIYSHGYQNKEFEHLSNLLVERNKLAGAMFNEIIKPDLENIDDIINKVKNYNLMISLGELDSNDFIESLKRIILE